MSLASTCKLPALSSCLRSSGQVRLPRSSSSPRSLIHAKNGSRRAASGQRTESLRPQTFYEFFPQTLASGPPPQGPFAINLSKLRNEFYQLQAKAHPDRFPAGQKARAEGLSARINEAYKALQDPLRRAQYLLFLRGIDVAGDETAKVEDPELLMEVLEMRETIEAIESEGQLAPLKAENDQKIEESVRILDRAFKADDVILAKTEVVKLRYWTNIKESLDGWEPGKPVTLIH